MLTLTNVIAPVRGFDPDSRKAEKPPMYKRPSQEFYVE